jgi:hypothetical protein
MFGFFDRAGWLNKIINYDSSVLLLNVGKNGSVAQIGFAAGALEVPAQLLQLGVRLRAIHIIDYGNTIICFNLIMH